MFSVLFGLNNLFDSFPVDLDFLGDFLEFRDPFILAHLLEVSLTVADHRVDVRFLLQSQIQGSFPTIEFYIEFNGTVEEFGLDQNLEGFVLFMEIKGNSGVARNFTGKLFDVVDVLHFIDKIAGG